MPEIRDNLERVREKIHSALIKTGRANEVQLIAVTKTVPPERIIESIQAGVAVIGENRVQEAEEKYSLIGRRVKWHLVGHLQRNKVKKALPIFEMIQSIDKLATAEEIEKRAAAPLDILIEVNSSGEETKSGVEPEKFFELVDQLRPLKMVRIKGVMTIGPLAGALTGDERLIRKAFSLTRGLFEQLKKQEKALDISILSMGMSSDFEAAIEEGSTMVRIGSAIFGQRV